MKAKLKIKITENTLINTLISKGKDHLISIEKEKQIEKKYNEVQAKTTDNIKNLLSTIFDTAINVREDLAYSGVYFSIDGASSNLLRLSTTMYKTYENSFYNKETDKYVEINTSNNKYLETISTYLTSYINSLSDKDALDFLTYTLNQ
jgi:hypothetical protein